MTVREKADDGDLTLPEWKWIDSLCSRFQTAHRSGERPDLGEFLTRIDGPAADRLFRELLAIDLEARHGRGESPAAPEYRERFATHFEAIEEAFSTFQFNGPTRPSAEA